MHRHGYKGRKFGRERDQRRALIKSLADSLILHESIETTLFKAKEVGPYVENLVTHAKKGTLADRRYILSALNTVEATHKLVDQIAPQLTKRNSGYLRIKRTTTRRGDNAQLATVSFVDELKDKPVTAKPVEKPVKKAKPAVKTPAKTTVKSKAKPTSTAKKPVKKTVKAVK